MSVAEARGTAPLQIAEHILSIRRAPARREELVALLAEQSAIYRGLGMGDAERIRGFVLASFEALGLPDSALPFVLEELETGINPYTMAAAAKALRGARQVSDRTLALLVSAAGRVESNDDNVQYDTMDPGDRVAPRTSALAEIMGTIAALRDRAHGGPTDQAGEHCCCASPPAPVLSAPSPTLRSIDDLALQDQSGVNFAYRDFFYRRPSVLTFFYTRCMNPKKCSLTISKLGSLQRRLAAINLQSCINIGAFTYDPAYDRASRLQTYGMDRGFRFDDRNRFIRTTGSFEPIRAKFDLGVGFGPATTNRHSVELLILDSEGETVYESRRALWDEGEVLQAIGEILKPGSGN